MDVSPPATPRPEKTEPSHNTVSTQQSLISAPKTQPIPGQVLIETPTLRTRGHLAQVAGDSPSFSRSPAWSIAAGQESFSAVSEEVLNSLREAIASNMAHQSPSLRSLKQSEHGIVLGAIPEICESPSSELSESDSGESYINALIRRSQTSDRPENESAWRAAMSPQVLTLLGLGFAVSDSARSAAIEAEALLSSGLEMSATDPSYGRTVVHWVVLLGDGAMLDWVLAHGGVNCLETPDLGGDTPLALLARLRMAPIPSTWVLGTARMVHSLLHHGASMSCLSYGGAEFFYLPDLHRELAVLLLKQGLDINGGGAHVLTPLFRACDRQGWEWARLLLSLGASVDCRGLFGASLLLHGSMPEALAQAMIEMGADVNLADMTGQTPLMAACEAGNVALVGLLLARHASVIAVDDAGDNVFYFAQQAGGEIEILIRHALSKLDLPSDQ